jgi:hypothetical protein
MSLHRVPSGDCLFCCAEFDDSCYAEYLPPSLTGNWIPSPYCSNCIQQFFIDQQWAKYLKSIAEADCAAALRRVLNKPPPLYVTDKGFASDESPEGVVGQFWFMQGDLVKSSKLKDALEGDERDLFWQEKKIGLEALEAAEAASGDMVLAAKAAAEKK